MFHGFASVWTPLIEKRRIGKKPQRIELAGEAIVLFRGADRKIGALIDRCPHRGAALSLGSVGGDGCLACPFHGWRFDVNGANQRVPFNPDAKRDNLGATPIPTRIIGEMVWAYTAPGLVPLSEPNVSEYLSRTDLRRTYAEQTWRCHWTRAMENMLDSPHLPFVHRNTIGRGLSRQVSTTSRMEVIWEETSAGGSTIALVDGKHGGGRLEYFKPNMMALHIPMPRRIFVIHALVIPVNETTTRLVLVAARDFARAAALDFAFNLSNRRIANEDRAIVESSTPAVVPPPGAERSVVTDRVTLAFRKYYYSALFERPREDPGLFEGLSAVPQSL